MNYNLLSFPKLFVFTFLFLSIFSTFTRAQTIQPDEEIKRRMIAYAAKVEASYENSRSRNYNSNTTNKSAAGKYDARTYEASRSTNYSVERRAFDLLNQQRASKGLRPLRWSEDMARVARLHSENMARGKFFSHYAPDGTTVYNRAKSLGIRGWSALSENIAFNRGFKKPVEMACQHWMTSPGHRNNILNDKWTESGIGVAVTSDGSYYFTQVFIAR